MGKKKKKKKEEIQIDLFPANNDSIIILNLTWVVGTVPHRPEFDEWEGGYSCRSNNPLVFLFFFFFFLSLSFPRLLPVSCETSRIRLFLISSPSATGGWVAFYPLKVEELNHVRVAVPCHLLGPPSVRQASYQHPSQAAEPLTPLTIAGLVPGLGDPAAGPPCCSARGTSRL